MGGIRKKGKYLFAEKFEWQLPLRNPHFFEYIFSGFLEESLPAGTLNYD